MFPNKLFIGLTLLAYCCYSCVKEQPRKYTIGVSQCSEDLWRETANKEMLREISFYQDLDIQIKNVSDNTHQQIEDIKTFIREGVDLLVIAPNESAAITPIVRKALDQGIPVILLDRKVELDDYTAYVGADNYALAYELGNYVGNLLHGKGRIVEIRGWEGSTADIERHRGFHDAIAQYTDIEVVAECRGNFLRNVARTCMDSILNLHDQIDLVFAMNDQMAFGVSETLSKYSGRRPYVIGIDALPGKGGGIEYIQQGIIDASFIYPTGGDKVIEVAHRILTGEPYNKDNILSTAVVDRNNVRVIRLQGDQINQLQNKFDQLNVLLNASLTQYANQHTLFTISLVVIFLTSLLLLVTLHAYRFKSRTNAQLKASNEKIHNQFVELEQQKQQLVELSANLEEATNAKLVFFTNISHELKTPLSLITGPVEILLSREDEPEEYYKQLTLIKRNSNKLLSLISEIIEFRAYENRKLQLLYSNCDLAAFLQEINDYFVEWAHNKQVSLELTTDGSDFTTRIDMGKIEKVYFNLLSNAFKYVNTKGRIETHLQVKENDGKRYVCFSVFNTGSFIPPDQIANVFERFYTTDYHKGSTGIGLALAKSIVELHGGTISIRSDEASGTTFEVCLPQINIPVQNTDTGIPPLYEKGYTQQQLSLMQTRVDDTTLLDDLENSDKPLLLLIEACNGGEGVQKAIKYIPDIIISDVMMPSLNGFSVCRILKEHISTSHIPLILLTALSLDEQKAIGFESGADAYISKPFNATILKIRIRKLIENRRKIRESFDNQWFQDGKRSLVAQTEQTFINKFRAYVEQNIQREELGVDEIARHLGFSRAQLYRKIKSVTNYSPLELIILTRLRYSRNLMLVNKKSISEAAYESGFSSPSHFTKTFRKYYGQSPSDFIKETKVK